MHEGITIKIRSPDGFPAQGKGPSVKNCILIWNGAISCCVDPCKCRILYKFWFICMTFIIFGRRIFSAESLKICFVDHSVKNGEKLVICREEQLFTRQYLLIALLENFCGRCALAGVHKCAIFIATFNSTCRNEGSWKYLDIFCIQGYLYVSNFLKYHSPAIRELWTFTDRAIRKKDFCW